MAPWFLGLLSLVLAAPLPQDDLARLLEGVPTLPAPGVPGPIAVFGARAFPLVLARSGAQQQAPVLAAAHAGSGRILVLGHSGYASAAQEVGMAAFLRNAVAWLAQGKARPRVGAAAGWSDSLPEAALELTVVDGPLLRHLDELDVVALPVLALGVEDVALLAAFVERGGGLLTAETGWGWQQLNGELELRAQPVQRWLAGHGLAFTLDTVERTHEQGFALGALEPERWNALAALARLAGEPHRAQANDAWTVGFAARALPAGASEFGARLAQLLREHGHALVASEQQPLTPAQPLLRALVAAEWSLAADRPAGETAAHPSAADFPGRAGAAGGAHTLELATAQHGWRSTGLWVDAGARVVVTLPAAAVAAGLRLRIGAHADTLWHLEAWRRMPAITSELALSAERTTLASAFGGALYLVVPAGCALGSVTLSFDGVVAAPHFVLGRTSARDWRAARTAPAPWAELEGRRLVLSVPSRVVRELDDPGALLEFWDRVLDAQATLAGIPLERARPERFVLDRQISAGYMHSGYPIMTHLDVAEAVVDLAGLRRGEHLWGFVHELGHNLQLGDWTFAGTGEVTNNLFALYAIEQLCALPEGRRGHEAVDSPPDLAAHLARGAPFEAWKSDPFLALRSYTLVQEAFGWEPFRAVFAGYAALPNAARPRSDDDKRDQWLVRLSRAVAHDLGPYFDAWGIPTSAAARAEIAELPGWMPPDWPAR